MLLLVCWYYNINIRSYQKNLDDLFLLICDFKTPPNIISISETQIKDISNTHTLKIDDYKLVNVNLCTNAGVVAMFVSDTLEFEITNEFDLNCPGCEGIWIKLRLTNIDIYLISTIYKHPIPNIEEFIECLDQSLIKASNHKINCVIHGNMNIDVHKSKTWTKLDPTWAW